MKYFTIEELTRSETAVANGIDNTPSAEVVCCLTLLTEMVLDPLRERWGSAINVTSGYRCEKLNKAVGGAKNSQHVSGQAADIKPKNGDVDGLFEMARKMGNFDQLIDERVGGSHWVHVSFNPNGRQRKEVLRYDGKKYTKVS